MYTLRHRLSGINGRLLGNRAEGILKYNAVHEANVHA